MATIHTISDFRKAYRAGQYAWPGGYPQYFITSDGAALSFEAAKGNLGLILRAIHEGLNDGWRVVGIDVNWEDGTLTCDHTGKPIECAYGEEPDPMPFKVEGVELEDGSRTLLNEYATSHEARTFMERYVSKEDAGGWSLIEVYDTRGEDAERLAFWGREQA